MTQKCSFFFFFFEDLQPKIDACFFSTWLRGRSGLTCLRKLLTSGCCRPASWRSRCRLSPGPSAPPPPHPLQPVRPYCISGRIVTLCRAALSRRQRSCDAEVGGGGGAAGGVNSRHSRRNRPFAGQLTPPLTLPTPHPSPPLTPLTSDTDPACQLPLAENRLHCLVREACVKGTWRGG